MKTNLTSQNILLCSLFAKKSLSIVAVIAIIFVYLLSFNNAVFASATTTLSVGTPSQSTALGSEFTMPINLDTGGEGITSAKVVVNYDQSKLEFQTFDSTGSAFEIHSNTLSEAEPGKLTYNTSTFTPINSTDALVFNIQFKAIGDGASSIEVSKEESALYGSSTDSNPPNLLSVTTGYDVSVSDSEVAYTDSDPFSEGASNLPGKADIDSITQSISLYEWLFIISALVLLVVLVVKFILPKFHSAKSDNSKMAESANSKKTKSGNKDSVARKSQLDMVHGVPIDKPGTVIKPKQINIDDKQE